MQYSSWEKYKALAFSKENYKTYNQTINIYIINFYFET